MKKNLGKNSEKKIWKKNLKKNKFGKKFGKKKLTKILGKILKKKIWEKIVPLYDCEKIIKSLNFRGELISMPSHLDHQTTISNPWRKFVHEVMNFHGLFMNKFS